jgi:hypothetical protein
MLAVTIDFSSSDSSLQTLTSNTTFTVTGLAAGNTAKLRISTGLGGYSVAWSGVIWHSNNTEPTITTAAQKIAIIEFFSDGQKIYGAYAGTLNYPDVVTGFDAYSYGTPSLWLDATDSSAASMAITGSSITTWKNKGTASASDYSAASGYVSPSLVANVIGTNAAALFDGATTVMASANSTYSHCPAGAPWTLALVFNLNQWVAGTAYDLLTLGTDSGSVPFGMWYRGDNTYEDFYFGSTVLWGSGGGHRFIFSPQMGWNWITIVYNGSGVTTGSNFAVTVNGAAASVVASAGVETLIPNQLGNDGNGIFSGYQMESIVYPTAVSGAALTNLKGALAALISG